MCRHDFYHFSHLENHMKTLLLILIMLPISATQAAPPAHPPMNVLIDQLENGTRQEMFEAAVHLTVIGPKSIAAEPLLLKMLRSDDDFKMTLACGITQGIGSQAERLVDDIRPLLLNKNFHLQYWACRALCAIGPAAHDTVPQLLNCLKNGKASVRHNAATALGSIVAPCHKGKVIVLKALGVALDDLHIMVREAAAAAILKITRNEA